MHHRAALATALLLLASPASGQVPASDAAAMHYAEGSRLYDEGKLEGAEAAYERAWAIRRSYDVALNLGAVELDQKKHREAAEHLSYALSTFPAGGKPEARASLEKRLALAMEHAARLELKVSVPTARVLVDGRALEAMRDPLFLDPGEHQIEATATGHQPWSRRPKLAAATTHRIAIELVPSAETPPNGDDGGGTARWLVPALVGGAGLAAIGVAIGFGVSAAGAEERADELRTAIVREGAQCDPLTPGYETPCQDAVDKLERHDLHRDVAITTGVIGGVLVASAGTALLLWPSDDEGAASLEATPMVGAGLAGIGLSGRF